MDSSVIAGSVLILAGILWTFTIQRLERSIDGVKKNAYEVLHLLGAVFIVAGVYLCLK